MERFTTTRHQLLMSLNVDHVIQTVRIAMVQQLESVHPVMITCTNWPLNVYFTVGEGKHVFPNQQINASIPLYCLFLLFHNTPDFS